MTGRTILLCSVLGITLFFCGSQSQAAEAGPGSVAFIISHASELNLTKKQKKQLHDLAKEVRPDNDTPAQRGAKEKEYEDGVTSILSADQLTKLKTFRDQSVGISRKGETGTK